MAEVRARTLRKAPRRICLRVISAKPAFDLVEPRGARRREVQVTSAVIGQPRLHDGMFVRCVVVKNDVDLETAIHTRVDPLEELHELLMPVP